MNKRGQFFLLAAVIIVSILFGLSAIYTSVETPSQDPSVYYLTKEIKYESGAVIDSGIFNALTEQQVKNNLENLTDYYASSNPGTDLIILYGNQTQMIAFFYTTQDTGNIGVQLGGGPSTGYNTTETRKYNTTFIIPSGDQEVTVVIDQDVRYTFKVKPGQMFFIILKKERQGEQFVAASKNE